MALAPVVPAAEERQHPADRPAAAFHLRITNTADGAVRLSVDNGATWLLVARVSRPVSSAAPADGPDAREVLRSNAYGMAFGAGRGRQIKVLPDNPFNRKSPSAILLNVPITAAVFKDFLPPVGSAVRILSGAGSQALPLPETYYPKEYDVLEFAASNSSAAPEKLPAYARDAAQFYLQRCLGRLRAAGRRPVTGILAVSAKLKPGDKPDAVTFLHDGAVAGIMNAPPFTMRWDTKQWADGEHMVEVRALDKHGAVLSRSKALVVVQNSAQT